MSTPTQKPKSPLYYVGFLLMVGGATFAGSAIAQQIKNTVEGRHYYDWLAIGVALAIVGFVLVRIGRRGTPSA